MKLASVEAVTQALDAAGVRYLVVGGLAVALHGYGRATYDLDFVVQLEPKNVLAAFSALKALGYRPLVPVTAEQFADPQIRQRWIEEKGMMVLNFHSDAHRETNIDFFVAEPFDFNAEYDKALVQELAPGAKLRVARLDTLIEMKRKAGRLKDLADAVELERIRERLREKE
ncbi:MAG: hypothetical protein QJR02_06155 [Sinobacteraceae bacterium]|nr:hypothetical protein [Nevskiaceae bacterium]